MMRFIRKLNLALLLGHPLVTFIHNPDVNLEVSGQLRRPTAFTPWKKPQVPIE